MARIALVTDSTCDLDIAYLEQYNINVIPLNVIFGDETYLDGVEIDTDQFFAMLQTKEVLPRTSQPSPGDFALVYERLAAEYDHIISIHISSLLSGTHQSALMARDLCPSADITVVDSKSASIGLGWVVLVAARAIAAGKGKDEVLALVEQAVSEHHILLTVESLEWLHRNGRIGKASALLGGLLSVRPILYIEAGIIAPHGKVRGKMEKVLGQMVTNMTELVSTAGPVNIGIVHAQSPELAEHAANLLEQTYDVREKIISSVGPVIGVNTGPGTVGFVVLPDHE